MKITKLMHIVILVLATLGFGSAAMAGHIKLKFDPTKKPDIAAGSSMDIKIYDDNDSCDSRGGIIFSLADPNDPPAGSIVFDADFATNGEFTFYNDGAGDGFLTEDDGDYKVEFEGVCADGSGKRDKDLKPKDSGADDDDGGGGGSSLSISFNPSAVDVSLEDNAVNNWTASGANGSSCPTPFSYVYSLTASPTHGTVTLDASFSANGQFIYTNDNTGNGFLGVNKETITIQVSCGTDTPVSADILVSDTTRSLIPSCTNTNLGVVILDNTATPGQASIATNLQFLDGCSKSDTTIDDGYGGNAININDYQTVIRNNSVSPHTLGLVIGPDASTLSEANFGTDDQLYFFNDGEHLFDLDRLRATADWLATVGNISPDDGVVAGTYGTITMAQFLDNIANDRTMYGIVRIKIGLEKGASGCFGPDCNKNALGQIVANSNDIYGFCGGGTSVGLCACAPDNGFKIQEGRTLCGIAMPSTAKIKVKGALLWDFVDHLTEAPISLTELPFAPRELYFKVEIPVMVNWDHDLDDDGDMDNMFVIKAVTNGVAAGAITPSPSISWSDIPQSSKDNYAFETGTILTETLFNALNEPNKYHMLMASGYADGWAESFDKLNITTATWGSLPPSIECGNYASTDCTNTFGVPSGVTGVMSANDVRGDGFEDIPTYLYSGGLIDMHDHVNISGLVYVPQAMEMEAKNSSLPTQQYVSGAIVVRDGFYIEAKDNTITVISSDPNSYSMARISTTSSSSGLKFSSGGPGSVNGGGGGDGDGDGDGDGGDGGGGGTYCIGCVNSGGGGGGGGGGAGVGSSRWIEVRPQPQ